MKLNILESDDLFYLTLSEEPVAKSKIVHDDFNYDFNEDGEVIGVEARHLCEILVLRLVVANTREDIVQTAFIPVAYGHCGVGQIRIALGQRRIVPGLDRPQN